MAEKGLGKGFGALFGAEAEEEGELRNLLISKVEPRESQPRSKFDEVALQELADSIREYGLIQPITARKLQNGYYQIIAGERRWRAARLAGLKEVPVRVIEADDGRAMEIALVENLQREDLNPIEEANGFRTLIEVYGLTQEQASQRVGKSRPAVANALRLLNLCPEVQKLTEQGLLSSGHARAIAAIRDEELQKSIADKVIAMSLSVRQTETLIARAGKSRKAEPAGSAQSAFSVDYAAELERSLTSSLGRRVRLRVGKKKGCIELEYYGNDDLEQLLHSLELFARAKGGGRRAD